ncbi:hypothetical protein THAOC_33518, partial [Thalassiosira oceanica]
GQSVDKCGILLPKNVWTHGQIYVAFSRCGNPNNVFVWANQEPILGGEFKGKFLSDEKNCRTYAAADEAVTHTMTPGTNCPYGGRALRWKPSRAEGHTSIAWRAEATLAVAFLSDKVDGSRLKATNIDDTRPAVVPTAPMPRHRVSGPPSCM